MHAAGFSSGPRSWNISSKVCLIVIFDSVQNDILGHRLSTILFFVFWCLSRVGILALFGALFAVCVLLFVRGYLFLVLLLHGLFLLQLFSRTTYEVIHEQHTRLARTRLVLSRPSNPCPVSSSAVFAI